MKTLRTLLILAASALVLGACASDGGSSSRSSETTKTEKTEKKSHGDYPPGYGPPPAGSKFAEVELDENDLEVRKLLGEPDDANAYMTGKAWIPFYFGSDVARTDWFYTGQGRIVFSRNRYSGGLKVIKILYNPDEPSR